MGEYRVDRIVASLAVIVLICSGCGKEGLPNMVPIRGEAIFQGEPLSDGFVVYLPKKAGVGRQATGAIKPDGSFVLTTQKGGDGAMHGEYDIVIFEDAAPAGEFASREEYEAAMQRRERSKIPQKYSNQATSGLSDTVDENHTGFNRIEFGD